MTTRLSAWVLLLLLVLCTVPLSNPTATLDDPVEVQTTEGRQLQDVNCSGMTFEDLFSYDRAEFEVQIDAAWTGRMAFDDRAGTVLCVGGVESVSPGPDGSIDSVVGDRLAITLTPLGENDAAPEGDRLRLAEVFGSEGTPARVESRVYAAADPANAGTAGESAREDRPIEALYRLEGTRIRFAAADDRVEVPVATGGEEYIVHSRELG